MIDAPSRLQLWFTQDVTRFAQALGRRLGTGDTILLTGAVGAGKTHFARSLIQSVLTEPEDVPSPTFTLVQTYDTIVGDLWHCDLYRLSSTQEIEELGLCDAFDEAVCLIEWPDRLGDLAPPSALHMRFRMHDDVGMRCVSFEWADDKWAAKLEGLIT